MISPPPAPAPEASKSVQFDDHLQTKPITPMEEYDRRPGHDHQSSHRHDNNGDRRDRRGSTSTSSSSRNGNKRRSSRTERSNGADSHRHRGHRSGTNESDSDETIELPERFDENGRLKNERGGGANGGLTERIEKVLNGQAAGDLLRRVLR